MSKQMPPTALQNWRIEITGHPEGAGGQRCWLTAEGGAIAQLFPCGNPRRALADDVQSDMPEPFMGAIMRQRAALLLAAPEVLSALIDLRQQVNDFCVKYGEADFYTGDATKAIAKATPAA
jgi:hypothetical protein